MALRQNITVRNARLQRDVEKFDLKVAEDAFTPDLGISIPFQFASTSKGNRSRSGGLTATITQRIQTGGKIVFAWEDAALKEIISKKPTNYKQNVSLTITQPLLKGAGFDVNTAEIKIARNLEEQNKLALKAILIDIVTSTITAYRQFIQAQKQIDINKQSLVRAEQLLDINKTLIQTGRMAEMEIIQTQADVANKAFDLLAGENSYDAARLALLNILGLDPHIEITGVAEQQAKSILPDQDRFQQIAFANRPDYLQNILKLEINKLNVLLAKNDDFWSIDLEAGYNYPVDRDRYGGAFDRFRNYTKREWNIGLKLNHTFGDLSSKQKIIQTTTALQQATNTFKELKNSIKIEVKDALRNVTMKMKQMQLAAEATRLSQQKLAVEEDKMKVGRSSNFQVLTFQNDLVNAKNSELSARTAYLNALTNLDKAIGSTLQTWDIAIKVIRPIAAPQ